MTDLALFLGRFHPLLVHFPIGLLILAGVLELVSRGPRFRVLRPAVAPVLALGAAGAFASGAAGYLLGETAGYSGATYGWHKWLGLLVVVFAAAAAAAAFARETRPDPLIRRAYGGLLAGTLALLLAAGHFGGTLAHGEGYLTEYAPEPIRRLLAGGGAEPLHADRPAGQTPVYAALIDPILQSRCASCHGAAKSEGGLRLHTYEGLTAGGLSGPAIAPGMAASSELVRRIFLPPTHRDAMPPRGQSPLLVSEAALLRWWIDQGAPSDARLDDVEVTADIRPILEALLGPIERAGPAILAQPVDPPDPAAVAALRRAGASVSPLAEGSPWLEVHCTNAGTRFGDGQMALLEPLARQVTWLDLSGTSVTDEGLAVLARFPHLTRLHLNRTAVTDEGLAHLAGLEHLEYLNLYGTAVTDEGLQHLAELQNLRALYLWQTEVTQAAVERLKTRLPRVEVGS